MLVTDSQGQDVGERKRKDKRQGDQVNLKIPLPQRPPNPSKPGQLVSGDKDSLLVTLWGSGDRRVTITDNTIYTNIADSDW